MSLLSPGLVLPLTPPAEPHLFLDDPFFEQSRHHFDLTVKQMSNRWSLSSPDHLSPFRSLHQNNVTKEDANEPGTKQQKIIEIQIETDDGDDTPEEDKTKSSMSNKSQSSFAEASTASETSSNQEIRGENQKTLLLGQPDEEEVKTHSLVGGLSLHRSLMPTLHQSPFFDDSFFRDVQSDFEETFDSILHGHNAKTSSKKLEECLSIPEDEVVNEAEIDAQQENTSDQKDAVGEQVAKECDAKVKGDKCLVEEGQDSKSGVGSVLSLTARPDLPLARLTRHNAIDKSLSVEKVPTHQEESDEKGCQDETHSIPDESGDKTDHTNEPEESSHQDADEHSEMKINEEVSEHLFNDEENEQTKLHLESSLDTIMEEPSTPMLELPEDKDIFEKELHDEERNEQDKKEQDSSSHTCTLNGPELLIQGSNTEPEVTCPIISDQNSDHPKPPQKEETPPVSSQQETDHTPSLETDLPVVSPVKLDSISTLLSISSKPAKPDTSGVIKRAMKTPGSNTKDEVANEEDIRISAEESEETPSASPHCQQTSPQSKRNSRVRFEDLPEQHPEQQKQNSKTQADDNQHKPCIKEHKKEKKDQERKNKKLHLYIPDIKISEAQSDDTVPLDLDNTLGQQKSPQDHKSLEQSLQQEESLQKTVQAPLSDNTTSSSSNRVRKDSTNSTISESSDISKPETFPIVKNSNKVSQEDLTNNISSIQKAKNDTNISTNNTCRSGERILTTKNLEDGELPIQRRGSFFRDSSFKEDHRHFRSAVSKVLERFGIRSSADNEMNAYKTLRQWIAVGESQAAKFIDGKISYKVVLDMSDFRDVKVKLDGQILVVEGVPLRKEVNSTQISRRCFIFPTSVDMGSVTSALSSDGVLTVTGPKPRRYSLYQEDAIR